MTGDPAPYVVYVDSEDVSWYLTNHTIAPARCDDPDRLHLAQGWVPWWSLHPPQLYAYIRPPSTIGTPRDGYRQRQRRRYLARSPP